MSEPIGTPTFVGMLLQVAEDALADIAASESSADELRIKFLGAKSELSKLTRQIRQVPEADRPQVGTVVNEVKEKIEQAIEKKASSLPAGMQASSEEQIDLTMPGILPPQGHLHIVTQAIIEITRIFERIGFTRVRHPEVDWDWYPFESLNMPANHPARDEWETFFVQYPGRPTDRHSGGRRPIESQLDPIASLQDGRKTGQIVLTPHTSNGQVREMEKDKLPIRMINIAKCYRRQVDVSHTPMFHQFEGLYIDQNVSIAHLKGVFDYFVKQFYGPDRKIRLRPFHFQFTEPSFEVDISCGICHGTGYVTKEQRCRLCKEGWLEMAGSGMVHPVVLKNGGVDTTKYSGFAFGWGIERAYMMKSGTKLDDLRIIYSNDVRFLEQF